MKKRGKTPLRTRLRQRPELLIDGADNLLAVYALNRDDTINTSLVEMRDARDGKLLAYVDKEGLYFQCPAGHQMSVSHQHYQQLCTLAPSPKQSIGFACSKCGAVIVSHWVEGISFDAAPPLRKRDE